MNYDRFFVWQCLKTNTVFLILTEIQQETANLFRFRDVRAGGVCSIVEPICKGMMGDGGLKIVKTYDYVVPTVYDREKLVNLLTFTSTGDIKAFGMKNVII